MILIGHTGYTVEPGHGQWCVHPLLCATARPAGRLILCLILSVILHLHLNCVHLLLLLNGLHDYDCGSEGEYCECDCEFESNLGFGYLKSPFSFRLSCTRTTFCTQSQQNSLRTPKVSQCHSCLWSGPQAAHFQQPILRPTGVARGRGPRGAKGAWLVWAG